jgi:hypothetical protein
MRAAIVAAAIRAALLNLIIWLAAGAAGAVPGADVVPRFAAQVAIASAFGAVAAGVVASRFRTRGARARWNRIALVVLVLSLASPLGLALGAVPIDPTAPSDTTFDGLRAGMGAIYAVFHLTVFLFVQRFVARELPE